MTIEQAFAVYHSKRFDAAFELLKPLAEQGSPDAQALLGSLYKLGLETVIDREAAKHLYILVSEQGSSITSNLAAIFAMDADYVPSNRYYDLARQQELVDILRGSTSDGEHR